MTGETTYAHGETGFSPLDAFRRLMAARPAIANQVKLHGQLAHVEWEMEKARLVRMILSILLGQVFLLCILLFAGAWLLAAAWTSAYRNHAFASLILMFALGAVISWRRFKTTSALGGKAFAEFRRELTNDAHLLGAGP